MEGVKDAPSQEEAHVLLEKRKEVPPPKDLASRVGLEKRIGRGPRLRPRLKLRGLLRKTR